MKVKSRHECHMHRVAHEVDLPDNEVAKATYGNWLLGQGYVQDIAGLDSNEQEILLSGTCQEAWDQSFAALICPFDCDGSSHPGVFCR